MAKRTGKQASGLELVFELREAKEKNLAIALARAEQARTAALARQADLERMLWGRQEVGGMASAGERLGAVLAADRLAGTLEEATREVVRAEEDLVRVKSQFERAHADRKLIEGVLEKRKASARAEEERRERLALDEWGLVRHASEGASRELAEKN